MILVAVLMLRPSGLFAQARSGGYDARAARGTTLLRHLAIAAVAGVVLLLLTLALSPYNDLQLATGPTTSPRSPGSPCWPGRTGRSRSGTAR